MLKRAFCEIAKYIWIERLEETLVFTIVEARGYPPFNIYSFDSTPFEVKIKDNDKLSLNTVQFKNNLALVSDTQNTFNTNWKNSVHWYSSDFTKTLPVAYCNDNTMRCAVTVSGQVANNLTCQVRMKWSYELANGNSGVAYSGWTTISNASADVNLTSSFLTLFGSRQAYYDLTSTLEWEFRTTAEETRGNDGVIGASSNPLYVTYKSPASVSSQYYHSLIHLGCVAANGVTAPGPNPEDGGSAHDDLVFQALWNKIASKSINKVKLENGVVVNDELLTYYGRAAVSSSSLPTENQVLQGLSATYLGPGSFLTDQSASLARQAQLRHGYTVVEILLRYKDGTCGTWQDFAVNLCGLQGLTCTRVSILPSSYGVTVGNAFKVDPTLEGQGGVVPRENTWGDHAVIQYKDKIYDPSYGINYGVVGNAVACFLSNLDSFGTQENSNLKPPYGRIYRPQSIKTVSLFVLHYQ